MANEGNIIAHQFGKGSVSEERAKQRKGGINSGKARRKKASLLKCAKTVLTADIDPRFKKQVEKLTGELEDEDDTLFTAAVAIMTKEALQGDVRAFHELKDLMLTIEDQVKVDESIEDDGLSAALEEFGKSL